MENPVPDVALRSLAGRYESYAGEVRRLIDAGFEVTRRTGTLDPRVSDIVAEAGLSNQAFYRHFRSKDELLVAMLDDGLARLVEYVEHEMAQVRGPMAKVRRWIEAIMAQAASPAAAERTRPFVLNSLRLADEFPDASRRSDEQLTAPLIEALGAVSGDPRRDAYAVMRLAMGEMHACLVGRRRPAPADVRHLFEFAWAGVTAGRSH